jgi:hypothetical protein
MKWANVKIRWETWARIAGDIELRCGNEGAKGLIGLVWLRMESFVGLLLTLRVHLVSKNE